MYDSSMTTVESHVLNFTGDVYREKVRLFFLARLREERAFTSTTELMSQIRNDVSETGEFFSTNSLDGLPLFVP